MKKPTFLIPFAILLLSILSACRPSAESTPIQIASYPSGEGLQNPQQYPPPNASTKSGILVYDATLSLTAWNVNEAIQRALQISDDYSGYLTSSSVITEGETYATLTFAIPAANYTNALKAFKRLGTVTYEQVSGSLYPSYGGQSGWAYTSNFTLHIRPRLEGFEWPAIDGTDVRPVRTFSSAFAVLVTLLSFLLDIAIWLIVVVGPFVLVGWGVKRVLKRKAHVNEPES